MNYKNNSFGAYLHTFNLIYIKQNLNYKFEKAILSCSNNEVFLEVVNTLYYDNYKLIILKSNIRVLPNLDYYVILDNDSFYLNVGFITHTKEFDLEYFYKGTLGVLYDKENITFRIWAPVSKEVVLVLNESKIPLNRCDEGVFEVVVQNIKNIYDKAKYYYLIRNDLTWTKALDPYGVAISSTFDACFVVNKDKFYKQKYTFLQNDKHFNNEIVYELNIRDFTISLPLKNKGGYLGIVESNTLELSGINYLKDLGITHVQLMPVNAFGGVDYKIKDAYNKDFKYNWGYNPILYNALCGWYASNPDNPYSAINEFKMMMDSFHEAGIGVILDVVYNHVYNMEEYAFNKIVPYYAFRYFENGDISNGSWCGNDIRSEALMNRKFILDSLSYYQNEFKIDGFRFDLMGLIDLETMNCAKSLLKQTNPYTLVYGEGWQMWTGCDTVSLAHMFNKEKVNGIGFFNDTFRNTLKGKKRDNVLGVLAKQEQSKDLIEMLLNVNQKNINYYYVNYVECHDNMTFYDEQKSMGIFDDDIKENAKMALIFVLFSKGLSFIHSGEEILRTKMQIDNSYNLPDIYNKFPWHLCFINSDLLAFTKMLIKVKKELNFNNLKHIKTLSKDKAIKVIYESNNELINLYFNLKKTFVNINLDEKEEVIFGKNNFKKNILITKVKK